MQTYKELNIKVTIVRTRAFYFQERGFNAYFRLMTHDTYALRLRVSQRSAESIGFLRVLRFPPTGNVNMVVRLDLTLIQIILSTLNFRTDKQLTLDKSDLPAWVKQKTL